MSDEIQETTEPATEEVPQQQAQGESPAPAPDDAYLRLAADFDNYRKRVVREQAEFLTRANERLVKELLPVLDDLGRALIAADQHEEAQLAEGVQLVHRQLSGLLEREGLAEIETNGRFDPHVHEALLSQPSDEEEGTVIEVVQKGYRLGDRVLRPAQVVVAAPTVEPPVRESESAEAVREKREVSPTDDEPNA